MKYLDLYELDCKDLSHETSARVTSLVFRDFDDFATLLLIVGHHMGQQRSIPGFYPGTNRGDRAVVDQFIQYMTQVDSGIARPSNS